MVQKSIPYKQNITIIHLAFKSIIFFKYQIYELSKSQNGYDRTQDFSKSNPQNTFRNMGLDQGVFWVFTHPSALFM